MSMIPVKTKLLCNGTSTPSEAMLDRVVAAGAMAGLGYAYGEDPGGESGYTGGGAYTGSGSGGGGGTWAGISDLLKLGLTIAGTAYLNNNQAKIATYGPNGTVLYQTSQIPSQYFQPAVSGGGGGRVGPIADAGGGFQMSTTAVVMIGVAALAVVMVMGRRH